MTNSTMVRTENPRNRAARYRLAVSGGPEPADARHAQAAADLPIAVAQECARRVDALWRDNPRLVRTADDPLPAAGRVPHEPAVPPRRLNLTALVERVVDGRGLGGHVTTSRRPVWVTADERLLTIALWHLLDDAVVRGGSRRDVVITVTDQPCPTVEIRAQDRGIAAVLLRRAGRSETQDPGPRRAMLGRLVAAQGATLRIHAGRRRLVTTEIIFKPPSPKPGDRPA